MNYIVVQWEGKHSSSDTTCAERWHFISRRTAVLTAVQPAVHCSEVWNASTRTHSTSAALLCREMKWKGLQGYIKQEWATWSHQISCRDLKVVGLQSAAKWAAWLRLQSSVGAGGHSKLRQLDLLPMEPITCYRICLKISHIEMWQVFRNIQVSKIQTYTAVCKTVLHQALKTLKTLIQTRLVPAGIVVEKWWNISTYENKPLFMPSCLIAGI